MKQGFTLIEVIITIIIISILAIIAVPNYTKAKEQALGKEAIANLRVIAAAEKIYKVEQGAYVACVNTAICNSLLKLDLSPENWDYSVTLYGGGVDIRATAERNGSGGYRDCSYTVNSAGDVVFSSGSCP